MLRKNLVELSPNSVLEGPSPALWFIRLMSLSGLRKSLLYLKIICFQCIGGEEWHRLPAQKSAAISQGIKTSLPQVEQPQLFRLRLCNDWIYIFFLLEWHWHICSRKYHRLTSLAFTSPLTEKEEEEEQSIRGEGGRVMGPLIRRREPAPNFSKNALLLTFLRVYFPYL